jgi:hypothetical protein
VFNTENLPDWRAQWDIWPRDIPIRRNMSSSAWFDFYSGILFKEIFIFDSKGPVLKDKIEEFFQQGKRKMTQHAYFRSAVGISDDQKMMLSLCALPASLTHLDGNPIFKG